ncbi:DUF3857 domain-containing transglutaminase family protein [Microbulbifer sp. ARAS458-1]|uniref:DUF3857 domain-containing transglutaminase family protein n=1 Tax=Microbulbifer sp. ARAS458-1 TaxID=3140242 RepID=UPI00387820C4
MKQLLSLGGVAHFLCFALTLILYPATPAAASSQPEYQLAARPSWVQPVELPSLSARAEADDGLRNLLLDAQTNLAGPRKERFFRFAMQPLRQQGLQQISSISLGFSPAYEDLVIHDVTVVRDGVRSDRLQSAEIKLFQREEELEKDLYAERWTAMLLLKDLRIGDIIEYSYTVSGSNPVLGDAYFGRELLSWGVAIERLHLSVLTPSEKPLYLRSTGRDDVEIRKQQLGAITRYYVDLHNNAALQLEDGVPEWLSPYPYIEFTQYADWREVNQWAHNLYAPMTDQLPAEFSLWLEELRGTPAEKAAATTQWIQEHIRYFGIEHGVNSHLPSSPLETFERRFGDCKDKTVLLVAALRRLGIEAYPALVSSIENMDLDQRLPSPGQFDHVITTLKLGGQRYWVDPTANNQMGSLDAMSLPDFHWALVVNGESSKLTAIEPATEAQTRGQILVEETLVLDRNRRSAELSVVSHYVGQSAEGLRSYAGYRDVQTISNDFLQFYARFFPGIELLESTEIDEVEGRNELRVRERYRLNNLGDNVGGQTLLKLSAASIASNLSLPQTRQRKYPFRLPGHMRVDERITVVAQNDEDLRWLEGQGDTDVHTPWFEFSREVSKEKKQLVIDYRYDSLEKSVEPQDFSEYLQAINRMDGGLTYSVWLAPAAVSADERRDRASSLARDLLKRR